MRYESIFWVLILLTMIGCGGSNKTFPDEEDNRSPFTLICQSPENEHQKLTIEAMLKYAKMESCVDGSNFYKMSTRLDLSNQNIADITPVNLKTIPNLSTLFLNDNPIANFQPISSLVKLVSLELEKTNLKDLSILKELKLLENLNLKNNTITDLNPIISHEQIAVLQLDGNPIAKGKVDTRKCPINGTSKVVKEWCKNRISSTRGQFLNLCLDKTNKNINLTIAILSDLVKKENCSEVYDSLNIIEELSLPNKNIKNIQPIGLLTRLKKINLDNNEIENIFEFRDLYQIIEFSLANNPLGTKIIPTQVNCPINSKSPIISSWCKERSNPRPIFIEFCSTANDAETIETLDELKIMGNSTECNKVFDSINKLDKIDLSFKDIVDLTPLRFFLNIKTLLLKDNNIKNLSPLQYLPKLEVLDLWKNKIEDITALQNLVSLKIVSLQTNQIVEIGSLKNLKNLNWLSISENTILDIGPLESLTSLQVLYFHHNKVSDLLPIKNLQNIEHLYFYQNKITSLAPLIKLLKLSNLKLDNNKVTSVAPLKNLTNIVEFGISYNPIGTTVSKTEENCPTNASSIVILEWCKIKL